MPDTFQSEDGQTVTLVLRKQTFPKSKKGLNLWSSNQVKSPYGNIQITEVSIDNQHIVRLKKTRFFRNFGWKPKLKNKSEIYHAAKKVAKPICLILKCNFYLTKTSLSISYYSLVNPYFYYYNIVWASTYKTNPRRLVILQKRIRYNHKINKLAHFNTHLYRPHF